MMAPAMPETTAEDRPTTNAAATDGRLPGNIASFRLRAGGYIVDMVILSAIAMVMLVAGGIVLLILTDGATDDSRQDAGIYALLSLFSLGTPVLWTALNLPLLVWRGQTGGQYVAGVRLVRADGGPLRPIDVAVWWFALNPLLFSWVMAAPAVAALGIVGALTLSLVTITVLMTPAMLCAVMPVVSLVAAAFDRRNRTLQDRIAGTVVAVVS